MIPWFKPHYWGQEKKLVNEVLDSTWISARGQYIEKFENHLADLLNANYAIALANGASALYLALLCLIKTKPLLIFSISRSCPASHCLA